MKQKEVNKILTPQRKLRLYKKVLKTIEDGKNKNGICYEVQEELLKTRWGFSIAYCAYHKYLPELEKALGDRSYLDNNKERVDFLKKEITKLKRRVDKLKQI